MSGDDKVGVWAMTIITAAIAAVICTAIIQSQMTERVKFERGYEQRAEQYQGWTQPMWRKR